MLTMILAETEEELAPLVAPPWVFALIAAVIFIVLAFAVWSYRDVANRHSEKTGGQDATGHGHH